MKHTLWREAERKIARYIRTVLFDTYSVWCV